MTNPPLSKKTKTEILEEYDKLLERYDELKMTSKIISEPQNLELLERVKDYTIENLTQSISGLKNAVNNTLSDLSDKLLSEAQKFNEIQKAMELSKKNLEQQYNIQIAAETLQNLIDENKKKTMELTEEIENKKRDWTRAQEEYEYNIKLQSRRDGELYKEERTKQEKELQERENILKSKEEEFISLKKQAEEFPQKLERHVSQREKEIEKKIDLEFQRKMEMLKKDWDAQKSISDAKLKNLEEYIKKQNAEITSIKQEAERATKKAQELAVKVVESSTVTQRKDEGKNTLLSQA